MTNRFTTDFQDVSDGDTISITPQNLVQRNALIEVVDAEVQWRGEAETTYNTVFDTTTASDSATGSTNLVSDSNVNSTTAKTEGETKTETKQIKKSNTNSGAYGTGSGPINVSPPSLPSGATVTQITLSYYLDEDGGAPNKGMEVKLDDDPYDITDFDSTLSGLSIGGNEKKKIASYSSDFDMDVSTYNSSIDGGDIKFTDTGTSEGVNAPTVGLEAEIEVKAEVTSTEQSTDINLAETEYPPVPQGFNFDRHELIEYRNGRQVDSITQRSNSVGESTTRASGTNVGDTVELEIRTVGTDLRSVSETASVNYPNPPSGYSVDSHEIEKTVSGKVVEQETVFEDRTGQSESITSNSPSRNVEVTITTNSSKTISNTIRTRNATIDFSFVSGEIDDSNVCILLDTSESINESRLQNLSLELLEALPNSSQVSLVTFDFGATEVVSLDTVSNNKDAIEDEILDLSKTGGTDIELGLETALDSLNGNDGSIFLFSDGLSPSTDPLPQVAEVSDAGVEIVTVSVGTDTGDELLEDMAELTGGQFFDNQLSQTVSGISLNEDELSEWVSIEGFGSGTQNITHSISGVGRADFRVRFYWEFASPEPRVGTVGIYDSSAGEWREAAVADPKAALLEYNHVSVYNEDLGEWGALDVVDPSNEAAIESHQFFDEDVGWLAPREFNSV